MKIRRLELENFRQFYGRQGLTFSTDPQKNVTLIYGSNGAGKTTLLNAFTWGLYGDTTPGLAESDWLISNLAWSEATQGEQVSARVRIEFEDQDRIYELERVQTARKGPEARVEMMVKDAATLHVTGSAGENERVENLEGAIGSILPRRLHRFAFFDGERDIDHLARPEATAQIEDAIKTVLGLEILERAITHIGKARSSQLMPELSKAGDKRDAELAEQLAGLEREREEVGGELRGVGENLAATEREIARTDAALQKIQAAQKLQERRSEFETALKAVGDRLQEIDRGVDEALRRRGYLAFTRELAAKTLERTRELEERGDIPAPIKQPFVRQLLDRQQCICGTELAEGSSEQEAVMAWFEKAGLPDVEARWSQLSAHAGNFQTRSDELFATVNKGLAERAAAERERTKVEQRASEIEDELSQVDDAEAQQMNDKRRELRLQVEKCHRELGAKRLRRDQLDAEIADTQRQLESAEGQSQKAAVARQRVSIAREAEDVCRQLLSVRTEQTRAELDARLKEVFGEMCFKPFVPALTDDFKLTLSDRSLGTDIPVAKSTGEGQILALSFVGVMAELTRKRYEESQSRRTGTDLLSFHGGVFPLTLDAVFGSLDDTYQDDVAAALPELAPQVVVMITRGSAQEAIRQRLWPRTGRAAVCTLYTSAQHVDDDTVDVPTGTLPYRVRIDEQRDRSEIRET